MLQVRKLVLAVAAATAFSSSFTHALGLGDLAVKSSLNQPLEAEISLLEVRDLTTLEIKSQLASPEDFSKAGIDRQFFLTGLKFSPVIGANGKPFIRVTSSKPVKEPYLNFLVEVLWPNGRLLREYTLLLDPPLYRPQQVIYAPQPAVTAAPSRTAQTAPQPAVRAATASTTLQGTEYRVQRNDTLWDIAQRTGGHASVHQTMLAIQDLNPNAFIDGNINRMKSGQVLRLPTEQNIRSRSRAEAIAQVSQQNSSWKTRRTAPPAAERQLDATHRNAADAAPTQIEKADSLRLVADAPGEAGQAADEGTAVGLKGLQDQLASSKERLDSTILENEDLSGRVDDLNSQIDKLKRLIELKDNQLAQLQNSIGAESLEPAVTDMVENNLETVVALEANPESLEPVEASVVDTAGTIGALDIEQESAATEVVAQPAAEVEMVSEAVVDGVESEPEPEPEPEPVAVTVQPEANVAEENSIVDTVMDNPMLLAAAGGAAVLGLLLLLMAISRSKARKEAELYDEQLSETLTPNGSQPDTAKTDLLGASSLAAAEESDVFAEDFAFKEPVTDTQFKQETSDPMVEANGYINFGRFNQAADVLNSAIEQEPQRVDLRLKLLEVYADLEDHGGFARQATEITEIGGADSELEQIKARYPQMLGAEQVANVVDDLSDDGFADLSLDDITLDLPEEMSSVSTAQLDTELDDLSALLADADSTDKPIDTAFSLDLELPESVTPAAETTFAFEDDFVAEDKDRSDLDIDSLSFDLDAEQEIQKPISDDEFSLDDLALELADTEAAETQNFDLSDDFSLVEQDQLEATDFDLQLDEVNAELESLSANLDADSLTSDTLTDPRLSEFDLDDLGSFEAKPVIEPHAATLASTSNEAGGNEFDLDDLGDLSDFATEPKVEPQAALTPSGEAERSEFDLDDLGEAEDDFSFLSGTDEIATKLDLARAYIDMGDAEGARDILDEVVLEGTVVQQDEARELISQLG